MFLKGDKTIIKCIVDLPLSLIYPRLPYLYNYLYLYLPNYNIGTYNCEPGLTYPHHIWPHSNYIHACMNGITYILYIHAAGDSSSDIIRSDEDVIESDHAAATSITTV